MSKHSDNFAPSGRKAPLVKCPHCNGVHVATMQFCPKTGAELSLNLAVEVGQKPVSRDGKTSMFLHKIKEKWYVIVLILLLLLILGVVIAFVKHTPPEMPIINSQISSVETGYAAMVPIRTLDKSGGKVWIDMYEVSVQEYRSVVGSVPVQLDGFKDDHPVVNVSYKEAEQYAQKAGKRLCTEKEWEAAAGVVANPHPDVLKAVTGAGILGAKTSVPQDRQFLMDRSVIGAFNLLGNVKEWIAASPEGVPQYIGASWRDSASDIEPAFRPQLRPDGQAAEVIGFRCCSEE